LAIRGKQITARGDRCSVLMSSTPFAYPQVVSRTFASFRVAIFSVSAAQRDFWRGFDSRQLHRLGTGQDSSPGPFSFPTMSTGRGDAGAAWPRVARFPADDEGLDVVPAIAVGGLRDALLEFSEEVGEEAGSACLGLAREGTEEAAVRTALRRYRPTGPACSPCATAEGPRTSPRVCSALWLSPSLLRAVACAAEVWHQDTSRIRHVRRSKTWPSARSPL